MTRIIGHGRYARSTYPGRGGPPGPQGPQGSALAFESPITLAAYDATGEPDFTLASVGVVNDDYQLILSPSAALLAAADEANVVAASAPAGAVWVRQYVRNLPAQYQDTWFVDPAGSDANDGATSGTALRTTSELFHRLRGAVIEQNTTVTLAAGTYGELRLEITVLLGVLFLVQGTVSSTAARTITAVTAQAPTTNTRGSITDPAPAWSDKSRLRLTSGTMSGAIAYVTGLSSATVGFVSKWARLSSGSSSSPTLGDPAINDQYVVDTLESKVGAVTITWFGQGRVTLKDLELKMDASGGANLLPGSYFLPLLWGCLITTGRTDFDKSQFLAVSCAWDTQCVLVESVFAARACVWRAAVTVDYAATLNLGSSCCFDGAGLVVQHGGYALATLSAADVQFVDQPSIAIDVDANSMVEGETASSRFWGPNTAASIAEAIRVRSGGNVVYTNVPSIAGGVVDTLIGSVGTAYGALPSYNTSLGCGIVNRA